MQRNKKIAIKRQVWNKGLKVGKRDGFTPVQVKRIRGLLADRGTAGLRDLALFATAVGAMSARGHERRISSKATMSARPPIASRRQRRGRKRHWVAARPSLCW